MEIQGYTEEKICAYCGEDCRLSENRRDWCDWKDATHEGTDHHACVKRYKERMEIVALHEQYCHTPNCDAFPPPKKLVFRERERS